MGKIITDIIMFILFILILGLTIIYTTKNVGKKSNVIYNLDANVIGVTKYGDTIVKVPELDDVIFVKARRYEK